MKAICGSISHTRTRALLLMAVLLSSSLAPLGNQGAAVAAAPSVEPKAMAALQSLGGFLRSLKAFAVSATSSTDQQIDNGQVVEFSHRSDLEVQMPDKLRLEVTDGLSSRSMIYDGRAFTLYDSRSNYYATEPAPSTIDELVSKLEETYGTELPLADLFRWRGSPEQLAALQSAIYIGSEKIGGEICDHYAFRQADIDWQVWMRAGSEPYPCQTVIIRRDNAERPRHTINYVWQAAPSIDPGRFEFVVPSGAHPVPIKDMKSAHSKPNEGPHDGQ